jgi:transposase
LAFIHGDRRQSRWLPVSIEEYVAEDDPVRVYDAFVERLDFGALGIDLDEHQMGPPEYDPKMMVKRLVFGYSYGLRSSRKLERAAHHNLSFIWLTGGLKPDHKTIARFRREHTSALRKVLKQCAQLCWKLKLIEGHTLFIDGTKMGANASLKRSWTQKKCAKAWAKVEARLRSILAECEAVDQAEAGQESLVHLRPELAEAGAREKEIEAIVKELEVSSQGSLNTTDPECAGVRKSKSGAMAGDHVPAVVDEKHGLWVWTDVVTDGNDEHQFDRQVKQAQETLERPCAVACADAGYANVNALKEPHEQGVKVIVPPAPSNSRASGGPFEKARFHYDPQRDV